MQIRSFPAFAVAAFAALVLSLAGCKTMEQQQFVTAISGAGAGIICYKNSASGPRVVFGLACGVGAAMLADWLQKGSQPNDAQRVADEYQRVLSDFSRTNLDNVGYPDIVTTTKEGQVRISLLVNHLESYPPATQCRGFSELTTLNGSPYSQQGVRPGWQSRRACRDLQGNAWTPWRIFAG